MGWCLRSWKSNSEDVKNPFNNDTVRMRIGKCLNKRLIPILFWVN